MSAAPTHFAVITLKPAVHPNANCKNMNVSGNVSLTPATSSAVSTCPQIMASVSTYICWSRYESIIGAE